MSQEGKHRPQRPKENERKEWRGREDRARWMVQRVRHCAGAPLTSVQSRVPLGGTSEDWAMGKPRARLVWHYAPFPPALPLPYPPPHRQNGGQRDRAAGWALALNTADQSLVPCVVPPKEPLVP